MRRSHLGRVLAGLGAVTGAFALTLQLITLTEDRGGDVLAAAWHFVGYFTILTNIFVTAICARAVLAPRKRDSFNSPRIEAAGLTAIILVALVYHTMLARYWAPEGLRLLADQLLHTAMPVIFLLFWLVRPHGSLRIQDAVVCAVFPLAYVAYALVRGAFTGFYPYGFIDASEIGPLRLTANVLSMGLMFLIGAVVLVGVDREVAKHAP